MSVLSRVMEYYPYVFHPGVTIGGGILLLIYVEWRRQRVGRAALRRRLAAFLGGGSLAFIPTAAYMLVTGQGPLETTQGNVWQVDALVAGGCSSFPGYSGSPGGGSTGE